MTAVVDLRPADRAFVREIARGAKESDKEVLDSLVGSGSTVVDGRFEILRVYVYRPKALDVSQLEGLRELRVPGDQVLTKLHVGAHRALRFLQAEREALASLDLSGCTALEEVHVSNSGIRELRLPEAAPLAVVDVSHNELESLDLRRFPKLVSVDAGGQPLASIELPAVPLHRLSLHHTKLAALPQVDGERLELLAISDIPVRALDLSRFPRLVTLFCDGCGLERLDLSPLPLLAQLGCENNPLRVLDCTKTPRLSWLDLAHCPLAELDLTGCHRLHQLVLDGVPKSVVIRADEHTRHLVAPLRKYFRISSAAAKPFVLHGKARDYNWDDGVAGLRKIIRDPACDLGTALLVYWNAEPDDEQDAKTRALLDEIEERVKKKRFKTAMIAYDPADQDGTDWTKGADRKHIPAVMFRAVRP